MYWPTIFDYVLNRILLYYSYYFCSMQYEYCAQYAKYQFDLPHLPKCIVYSRTHCLGDYIPQCNVFKLLFQMWLVNLNISVFIHYLTEQLKWRLHILNIFENIFKIWIKYIFISEVISTIWPESIMGSRMYLAYYCLKRVYCTASYTIFRQCVYIVWIVQVCYSEHVHKCLAKLKVSNIYFVKDFNAIPIYIFIWNCSFIQQPHLSLL